MMAAMIKSEPSQPSPRWKKAPHVLVAEECQDTSKNESLDDEDDFFVLPLKVANKSKFPPGCPVQVCLASSPKFVSRVIQGIVQEVGIDLSEESNRVNRYRVTAVATPLSSFSSKDSNDTTTTSPHHHLEVVVQETELQFNLGCPVWMVGPHNDCTPKEGEKASSKMMRAAIVIGSQHVMPPTSTNLATSSSGSTTTMAKCSDGFDASSSVLPVSCLRYSVQVVEADENFTIFHGVEPEGLKFRWAAGLVCCDDVHGSNIRRVSTDSMCCGGRLDASSLVKKRKSSENISIVPACLEKSNGKNMIAPKMEISDDSKRSSTPVHEEPGLGGKDDDKITNTTTTTTAKESWKQSAAKLESSAKLSVVSSPQSQHPLLVESQVVDTTASITTAATIAAVTPTAAEKANARDYHNHDDDHQGKQQVPEETNNNNNKNDPAMVDNGARDGTTKTFAQGENPVTNDGNRNETMEASNVQGGMPVPDGKKEKATTTSLATISNAKEETNTTRLSQSAGAGADVAKAEQSPKQNKQQVVSPAATPQTKAKSSNLFVPSNDSPSSVVVVRSPDNNNSTSTPRRRTSGGSKNNTGSMKRTPVFNTNPSPFQCIEFGRKDHNIQTALKELRAFRQEQGRSKKYGGVGWVVAERCLQWQFTGECSAECKRSADHIKLSTKLARALEDDFQPVIGPEGPLFGCCQRRQQQQQNHHRRETDGYARDRRSSVASNGRRRSGYHDPILSGEDDRMERAPRAKRPRSAPIYHAKPCENWKDGNDNQHEPTELKMLLPAYFGARFQTEAIMGRDGWRGQNLCDTYSCSIDIEGTLIKDDDQSTYSGSDLLLVRLTGRSLPALSQCQFAIEDLLFRAVEPPSLRGYLLTHLGHLNNYREKSRGIVHSRNPMSNDSIHNESEEDTLRHMTVVKTDEHLYRESFQRKRKLQEKYPSLTMKWVGHTPDFPNVHPHILLCSTSYEEVFACRNDLQKRR